MQTKEKIEQFVIMYIFFDVSLLSNSLQKVQQHQHTHMCKNKTMLFVYFITHCVPCMKVHERTILKPIELIEKYMFLKYLHTQANKIFQSLKNNNNENIDHSLNSRFFKPL
jgi:hypothetical protein